FDLAGQRRRPGVLCLGGAEGAVLGAAAMKALPVGVPKIIVTPIASGKRHYGPLIGNRDVMVMHSVVDILGINPISQAVFDNAAAAVVGMAAQRADDGPWTMDGRSEPANTGDETQPTLRTAETRKYVAI